MYCDQSFPPYGASLRDHKPPARLKTVRGTCKDGKEGGNSTDLGNPLQTHFIPGDPLNDQELTRAQIPGPLQLQRHFTAKAAPQADRDEI
jgi:hypothetical protein